jgi:hypothetical protein
MQRVKNRFGSCRREANTVLIGVENFNCEQFAAEKLKRLPAVYKETV